MLTLSFESSAIAASVCLTEGTRLIAQSTQCSNLTHSRTLLPMAEDMLKNCDFSMKDIDAFAVACGPGSFTGIRIGIATVKGLGWALNKPCIGISTLLGMAYNGTERGGYICCCMDARRNQIYNALFEIKNGKPARITDDRPIGINELISEIRNLALPSPVLLLGDGADLTAKAFQAASLPFDTAPENLKYQSAFGVAMAAEEIVSALSPDKLLQKYNSNSLLPVYLRLSQAERERNERLARENT